ncbi:MAG: hypothetical protein ACI8UO_005301 [Verrucomicrobiales bacterium]|jgi:hypothetical protein
MNGWMRHYKLTTGLEKFSIFLFKEIEEIPRQTEIEIRWVALFAFVDNRDVRSWRQKSLT